MAERPRLTVRAPRIYLWSSLGRWPYSEMPTVLRTGRFRFFFFSNERQEPPHIHVQAAERYAKFWLGPAGLSSSIGFTGDELTLLGRIVDENSTLFKERWDEFFNR